MIARLLAIPATVLVAWWAVSVLAPAPVRRSLAETVKRIKRRGPKLARHALTLVAGWARTMAGRAGRAVWLTLRCAVIACAWLGDRVRSISGVSPAAPAGDDDDEQAVHEPLAAEVDDLGVRTWTTDGFAWTQAPGSGPVAVPRESIRRKVSNNDQT